MPIWMQTTLDALASLPLWRAFGRVMWRNLVADGRIYLACVAAVWAVLHGLLRHRLSHRLISGWPSAADLRREIAYSASSLVVVSAGSAVLLAEVISGWGTTYRDPLQYGWAWLLLSLPVAIIAHDFYFYWTHRLLHTRWLFRHVHAVHHRSREPSPWAALSFHPVEALLQGAPLALMVLVMPLNDGVIVAYLLHQMLRNAIGHAAVEVLPRGFARHWFWGRFATTTHHHLHHETARGNYGLWFTWWDRWHGTENPDYLARFDAATNPRPRAAGGNAIG